MATPSAHDPPRTHPGRIGPYRITGELGRGGIGTVYRAIDPGGRPVALKCLLGGGDPDTDGRLLRESSIRLEHPNVVRTLGGGLGSDGRPYLVLELLEGQTLREAFVDAAAGDVVSWVAQAATGVAALHAEGLVHRDIKPENLFLCRDGTVKVLDLGIAAWVDDRARLTATGAVIGTPAYLAPEQVRGERALDPRIDVWALGVVLFEGLTGRSPFRRDGVLPTMLAVSIDPIPRVDDLAPHVPPRLSRLVHRCLERTPDLRLGSAEALATGLRDSLAHPDDAPDESARARGAETHRTIALFLARPTADVRPALEGIVGHAGGEVLWLPDGRAVGIFGASESTGDEAQRVLTTAHAIAKLCEPVALAMGRGSVGRQQASGEAVREAGEALARAPGGVVCGPITAQLLRSTHALDELAPGLFSIGRDDARVLTPSPLLARDVELAMLRRARDAAIEGREPVVTWIVGAPGTGKTRLAEAVRGLAAESSPPMLLREAHARSGGVPMYALFERALRGEQGVALRQRATDATVRVDQAREALVSELTRLAEEGPVAIVLEDVQWADGQSLALIEDLPRRVTGLPIWLVVTGRSEVLERLREPPERSACVEPAPLSPRDAMALAKARGHAELRPETAQALVAHTGGNPLFVELILDAHGSALDTRTLATIALPATVEFAVQARIDQLPPAARDVLSCMSLLARPVEALELVELGCADAASSLERLSARELVVRGSASDGARTYRVRSPVVAQVAAGGPSDDERRELHRRAASLGMARHRDEEEIAQHLEAAGEPVAAASAFLAAALAAMNGGDARKVLRCGSAALRCGLPVEDAFDLHLARADAARWAGELDEQIRALEDAERASSTELERARVLSARGELLRRTGEPSRALDVLGEAVTLAEHAADADTAAWARCRRSIALATLGRLDEAAGELDAISDAAPEATLSLSTATRGAIEDARGYVAGSRGDLGERRASFARAAELHAAAGDLRRAAGAESNAADAASLLGMFDVAETGLRRAIQLARRVGNRLTEGYALANLGRALTGLERVREAHEALSQASAIAQSIGDLHLLHAARLYACQAEPGGSETGGWLASLLEPERPGVLRAAAHGLAAMRSVSEPARALEHARLAVALVDEGLEEGELEILGAAHDALAHAGRTEEAHALRERARVRLDALASRITDDAARQSFVERVPGHRWLR